MIKILKSKNKGVEVINIDFRNYMYGGKVDAIFAFDSLIHINKDELLATINRFGSFLNENGIFLITFLLKPEEYTDTSEKADEFGVRRFFYFSFEDMKRIAEKAGLKTVNFDIMHYRGSKRAYIILKKCELNST
jgi:cyclopropane fatty-acyl-phospholipid synthase-like methyltransferase